MPNRLPSTNEAANGIWHFPTRSACPVHFIMIKAFLDIDRSVVIANLLPLRSALVFRSFGGTDRGGRRPREVKPDAAGTSSGLGGPCITITAISARPLKFQPQCLLTGDTVTLRFAVYVRTRLRRTA